MPIVQITSTTSGNNIVLDYLIWDWAQEALPPVLTRTLRLCVSDIAHVLASFLGLRPSLLPAGTHLFTLDKNTCRKSLLLDDPQRRAVLAEYLGSIKWDILATNLAKHEKRRFPVDQTVSEINDQTELERLYRTQVTTLPFYSIDMPLLSSDVELWLPNKKIFSQAALMSSSGCATYACRLGPLFAYRSTSTVVAGWHGNCATLASIWNARQRFRDSGRSARGAASRRRPRCDDAASASR